MKGTSALSGSGSGDGRDRRSHSRGFALVGIGAVLWGTGGIAGAIVAGNSAMSWPAISSLRLFAGGILMLGLTVATGELRRAPRTPEAIRRVLATGALTAVYGTAYFQSLPLIGVAVATVACLGAAPVAVAIHTAIRERRMPTLATVIALLAALAGLALVSRPTGPSGDVRELALGLGLAVLAGLAFAITTVINHQPVAGLSSRTLIGTSLTVAGALSAPLGLVTGVHFATVTAPAWGAIAFLIVFQTMLAYLAYYGGLQTGLPSTTAVIVLLIEPLTAAVLAVLILDESLTGSVIAGMALLMLAIVLVRPDSDVPTRPESA